MLPELQPQYNFPLYGLNTFGIRATAARFITITKADQLAELVNEAPVKILGGGSNVLITKPVEGLVLHNKIKGINLVNEDEDSVWLRAGSGEIWHDLVLFSIANGWGGLENLALIPGTVGASPIQNIGAYGAEVKDVITEVEVWHWDEQKLVTYENESCRFGYRDSIFKQELKNKVVVTAVTFKLGKNPVLRLDYGAIRDELTSMNAAPSVQTVAQAVMNIRRSKLPDPAVIGNAGSFFKNPTIDRAVYDLLLVQFPAMPAYPAGEEFVKVPAGWLIEQCGWKGFRRGDVGVHARQALVLVNYGDANGLEIWELSGEVLQSVQDKFGILLEREVQVW